MRRRNKRRRMNRRRSKRRRMNEKEVREDLLDLFNTPVYDTTKRAGYIT